MSWLRTFLILGAAFAVWRWRMDKARLVLAQTIYGEARGEGWVGMAAVASVVMNRVRYAENKAGGFWWGDSVITVCKKPYQFSAWNENDPNAAIIRDMAPGANATFDMAYEIAGAALAGTLDDPTGGADHYYNPDVVNPAWATTFDKVAEIGRHVFFRGYA
jgi:N-acetylmuramoyl-L-alanine amidase